MLKDKIIAAMEKGDAIKNISKWSGVGPSKLYELMKHWNIKRPRGGGKRGPHIPPPEKDTLVRIMIKHKFNASAVGPLLGVSGHTVNKWCREYGIPLGSAKAGRGNVDLWDTFLSEN